MAWTEPFAIIIGFLLIVKVAIDNHHLRKMQKEIKSLNGILFRKDGVLDTLQKLQKTDKPEVGFSG